MSFNESAPEVYSRQIMMKEIGEAGQNKLANASVLVIGCGGLGSPALYYLTAMGIGHLGLCDYDVVSFSNLNRQVLFTAEDVGRQKAPTSEKRLLALNPKLKTTVYDRIFDGDLAREILPEYDIVVDCLDNFPARFVLNDACIEAGKPFVHAGIGEFCGQLMTITPGNGPCLRCLFPGGVKKSDSSKPFGVVGPTPGVIGAMQALEAMKYLLGLPVCNDGLMVYDGLNLRLEKVTLSVNPECKCNQKSEKTMVGNI
jgi:molybdopterin/thiamine biosynthesis adenylyltransferase